MTTPTCARCQSPVDDADRYCRSCGYAMDGRPDYAQDLHQNIVETVPVGLFILDQSSRVRYWNRTMEEQSGRKRRDALGRVVFEVLPYLQPFTHRITRVFDTALPVKLDQVTHEGGEESELTETYYFRPMLLEDGSSALLAMMEDITQKVRVDNQLIRSERLAAIGELAAGVAHNFNNILAAIGGDAQLLKLAAEDEKLPQHVIEAAEQIYDETMRGGRIAHDLLSFARGAEPQIQRLDVGSLIEDAVRLTKNHPSARSVSIEVEISSDIAQIEADPNQLHQVFFNMILNALQAMPHGGVLTIGAGMRTDDDEPTGGMMDVKFHDTGVGIPREHLKRVFDPFYSRRANGGTGSGLGLPVSLAMMKSLGGDVQITSAEGIGTTVTISLPIVERRTAPRAGTRPHDQGRALIVDEDADVRRTLTTLLSRRGYEVVTATDSEEALFRFEEAREDRPFHVAITELMPPLDGGGEPDRLLSTLSATSPVIVLTGATDEQKLVDALEGGAQYAFSKPANFSELLAAVELVMEERGLTPA